MKLSTYTNFIIGGLFLWLIARGITLVVMSANIVVPKEITTTIDVVFGVVILSWVLMAVFLWIYKMIFKIKLP